MIELRNVSVSPPHGRAQPSTILDDIHLSIAAGEWVTLAGPNGSGKTTLLKTIAGLVTTRTGEVTLNGVGAPGTIGLLLQEPDNQFVASSVRSELALSLPREAAELERRERLGWAIDQFSLSEFLDRNPHRLSGGEKQRLAFATVWLSSPRMILLDEPTSYLDDVERERCLQFVGDLHRAGVAVVWATPTTAGLPGDRRLVYLEGGRITYDGAAGEFHQKEEDGEDVAPSAGPRSPTPRLGGAVVALRSVDFGYDDRPVFTDLSMELREGESAIVAGRNGAGKSTLLGLLGGVLKPSRGRIDRMYRRSVESGRQNVFFLFQNPERLFFAETVSEEIAFGLKALKIPAKEMARRIDQALAHVGLPPEHFRERMPFTLSLGEMRRLAFAITLSLDPRFLLMDEPGSCLDAAGWAVLRRVLEQFRREERAVVVATHDRARFSRVMDRVIELPPAVGRPV
jgi:energy-coupling factor transport system ATP-binding protein